MAFIDKATRKIIFVIVLFFLIPLIPPQSLKAEYTAISNQVIQGSHPRTNPDTVNIDRLLIKNDKEIYSDEELRILTAFPSQFLAIIHPSLSDDDYIDDDGDMGGIVVEKMALDWLDSDGKPVKIDPLQPFVSQPNINKLSNAVVTAHLRAQSQFGYPKQSLEPVVLTRSFPIELPIFELIASKNVIEAGDMNGTLLTFNAFRQKDLSAITDLNIAFETNQNQSTFSKIINHKNGSYSTIYTTTKSAVSDITVSIKKDAESPGYTIAGMSYPIESKPSSWDPSQADDSLYWAELIDGECYAIGAGKWGRKITNIFIAPQDKYQNLLKNYKVSFSLKDRAVWYANSTSVIIPDRDIIWNFQSNPNFRQYFGWDKYQTRESCEAETANNAIIDNSYVIVIHSLTDAQGISYPINKTYIKEPPYKTVLNVSKDIFMQGDEPIQIDLNFQNKFHYKKLTGLDVRFFSTREGMELKMVKDNNNGSYTTHYVPQKSGTTEIIVMINDNLVEGISAKITSRLAE